MKNIKYFMKNYFLMALLCFLTANYAIANNTIQVTDVNQLPWDERFRMGDKETTNGKLLFSLKNGGNLLYVKFNPGWNADGTEAHYHTFHEWGYVLDGDFPIFEFVSPNQKKGSLVNMRPGTFMDRPAYSLHGNRAEMMEKQIITPGSTQLLFYETGKTVSLNTDNRSYSEEWKSVDEFFSANFQQTADTNIMEWEEDNILPGVFVKWLSDHTQKGFTAKLRYAPSGWTHPKRNHKSYNEEGYKFMYILSGDMNVIVSLEDKSEKVKASQDFFINQPPMSIWNWGDSAVTQMGVTWLEVEYGKGTTIGDGPIVSSIVVE